MPTWLSFILEVLKLTIPALIVFLTAYYILKTYLENQYRLKMAEIKQGQIQTTLPLKLQAYERLSMLCERIAIPNLLLRIRKDGMTAGELQVSLLLAIQQEYEHNITQQVYVSGQLWEIIKMARDEAVNVVALVAEKVGPRADGKELAQALFNIVNQREAMAVEKALMAIKKEAAIVL
ncbi:MAG: hypothetical protein H6557_30375 [Lewinellaceae bacterium]|nr:hypothetical protein [Phaeodactylibacter sp.]MCB9040955.1 hypothetical protein [Lewinellaceae bacterium]